MRHIILITASLALDALAACVGASAHLFVGGLIGAWLAPRDGSCISLAVLLSVSGVLLWGERNEWENQKYRRQAPELG